jgi:hypothetical protein
VNDALKKIDPAEEELFTVTLMSKNSAQVGIRLQKSVEKYPGINNDEKPMTLIFIT